MEITYRRLKPEESGAYRQIRLESLKHFPDGFGASYEEESKNEKLRFETFIELQIIDKFMIGAFDQGDLVGICGFIKEEQLRSSHRGIVIQMYVKPEFTGKKIGYNILKTLIEEAFLLPGLELLTLGVVGGNLAANKIYRDSGFKEYGFLNNYFKHGVHYFDQLFMVLYKP